MALTILESLDLGAAPDDGNGDPLRPGGVKINSNFDKMYVLARVVQETTLQVYKGSGNADINNLEAGDIIRGFFSPTKFADPWVYNGGDVALEGSYTKINTIDF